MDDDYISVGMFIMLFWFFFKFLQSRGHFWKDEGVRALSAKDYSQAIKLLNLALQFPNSSADLSYIVNNSLATAYFETKQYVKAVEKGRECFKFRPTKSQVQYVSENILECSSILCLSLFQTLGQRRNHGERMLLCDCQRKR